MFLKSEIKRLYKLGVFTNDEYEKFMETGFNDNGELNPCVLPDKTELKYCLKFNPDDFDLVDVVEASTPWLGADYDFPELFGKYGYTVAGLCDGFV